MATSSSPYDELPENHREAIHDAIASLTDEFMDDVVLMLSADNPDFNETTMSAFLPPQFAHRYSRLFVKKFFIAFTSAAWKISQPDIYRLSCVAEELAAEAIVARAETILELHGEKADFGLFRDGVFEDMDFEWLFSIEMDGIEDSEMAEQMGMGNLRFDDWFKQFSSGHPRVPPYVED